MFKLTNEVPFGDRFDGHVSHVPLHRLNAHSEGRVEVISRGSVTHDAETTNANLLTIGSIDRNYVGR
jgi:hypothetical protein